MRPARSLLIYTLVVFVGGALVAPWLYWLVQSLAPHSHLAQSPFHRYVDRSILGLALIGIYPLLRSLEMEPWKNCGPLVIASSRRFKLLGQGLALGFGSLAAAAVIALAAHARQFNADLSAGSLVAKLAAAAATAIIVAILEEILFRDAIFGALRKVWNWRAALLVSSMIYAIVHFLARTDLPGPVTWSSGLRLLPLKLAGFGNLQVVIPGFFNLTLAGILLGLAYQHTGNLYFSIGLHAGWIFWLKSYDALTSPVTNSNLWLWGTDKLIDGWLALAILTFALLILLRLLPPQPKSPP